MYDREYMDNQPSWDSQRPVRKALRQTFRPLPALNCTLLILAFGKPEHLRRARRAFTRVLGIDVNEDAVQAALVEGFEARTADVTKDLDLEERFHVAQCPYLFEHLTDQGCVNVIRNLTRAAPVNVISLTAVDDPAYRLDPTHINPKFTPEWGKFLRAAYRRLHWRETWHQNNSWAFASPAYFRLLEQVERAVTSAVAQAWEGMK